MTSADGTVERLDDGRHRISFERRLDQAPERVWEALTDPQQLIAWWGEADVELRPGGRFDVRWLNTDEAGNRAEMHARIVQLEPGRRLVLDGDIHGRLEWELEPDEHGTLLSFRSTTELDPDFVTLVPAGWHFHLDALAAALDGRPQDLVDLEAAFEPIHARYVAGSG